MTDWKESVGNYWKPEKKGDEIVGVLVKIEEKVGPNESVLYHLETPEHESVQVWGATVLNQRMAPVKVGEEVKIIFEGTAEKGGRGKNKPKLWKVFHRTPDIEGIDF